MRPLLKFGSYAAIAVALVGSGTAQYLLVNGMASRTYSTRFAVPYAVAAVVTIGCIQLVLIALARLVMLATNGRGIDRTSVAWVTATTWLLTVATTITMMVSTQYVLFRLPSFDANGVALITLTAGACLTTLLAVVLRFTLHGAIADREELAEVI
jgi:hypothetical protein